VLVLFLIAGGGATATGTLFRAGPWWVTLYLAAVVGLLVSHVLTGECILTRWEKQFWELHRAGSAYAGSFLENYFPWLSHFINRWGTLIIPLGILLRVALWLWARRS